MWWVDPDCQLYQMPNRFMSPCMMLPIIASIYLYDIIAAETIFKQERNIIYTTSDLESLNILYAVHYNTIGGIRY
jgi:hypothetical protein